MKKEIKSSWMFLLIWILFSLTGCGISGTKTTSMSLVYGIVTVISLFLLVIYCGAIEKKELWFALLFSSVFVVNLGYFAISISKTLEEALLANRISYLGSVFLPMSMFMIIIKVCGLGYRKWLPCLLLFISVLVFLVAASPGYCTIYYKDVVLQTVNGVSVLDKTYGEWHSLYMLYLVSYFGVMMFMSIRIFVKKKTGTNVYAIILLGAVFVNIGVWLLEQFVKIDFEVLSVSYIITEFFMLCLALTIQEHTKMQDVSKEIMSEKNKMQNMIPKGTGTVGLENKQVIPQREAALEPEGKKNSEYPRELAVKDMKIPEHSLELAEKEMEIPKHLWELSEKDIENSREAVSKNTEKQGDTPKLKTIQQEVLTEQQEYFLENIHRLTPTENIIYDNYLKGKTTKVIMKELNITENTLKYHNKNIYSKLGVSSRKKLVEIAMELKEKSRM